MTDAPSALRLEGLTKTFGAVRALQSVDLEVRPATVHALLGGNGSGKSTVVKILAGVYPADGGTVELGGERFSARSYRASDGHRHGLRFVHQDLGLIETATIAENMAFVRGFPTVGTRISWSRLHDETAALLARYEIDASPRAEIGRLRPADRTMVAIARTLGARDDDRHDDPILVLDEPTASLARHESTALLDAVRQRARDGQTVIIISHHLGEVLEHADELTVLRDGRTATSAPVGGITPDDAVALIAGRSVTALERREPPTGHAPVLEVRGLAAGPLADIDLDVAAGEIVGVAGLLGSGRSSLLRAIFGDLARRAGKVSVGGAVIAGGDPRAAMRNGVALVPQDRLGDAAFTDHTVGDNLTATMFGRYWRGGVTRRRAEHRDAAELVDRFGVRTPGTRTLLSTLSGGNQQKTVLARWLRRDPAVLLLDEPTQGVDAVARADIYRLVREATSRGCAVVVASSDNDELALLCDRAVVLAAGRVVTEVAPQDMTPEDLIRLTQTVTGSERTAS